MAESSEAQGPDLTKGVGVDALQDGGMVVGRVGDDEVVLARSGGEFFAIGAHCTHYHGPLGEGLIVGETVRCPWHHACFSLRSGEPLRAPALDPIACWKVERQGETVFVREPLREPRRRPTVAAASAPASVIIVGGGGAGLAAADMLRREGYDGSITMISADDSPPTDRPNLSKDYLAGQAQDDWIPLKPAEYFTEQRIELLLKTRVAAIDVAGRQVLLDGGARRSFGSLLIATGAEPVRLPIPGADGPHVHDLRSFSDSHAIVDDTRGATRAVVVGASFIALEVTASLRTRGIAVDVVAPGHAPLERVLGLEVGRFIQNVHEEHGVVFHLGRSVTRIDGHTVTMSDGTTIEADVIVFGVGVRPAIALAEQAGLAIDRGIAVNEYLETSGPGIFAAGDVARWPDRHSHERIRVEHWVVAERLGQTAARNMLGRRERFEQVPFFWSQHFDVTINYVGHAETWNAVTIDGTLDSRDCTISYMRGQQRLAVATIGRDLESLRAEAAMEQ